MPTDQPCRALYGSAVSPFARQLVTRFLLSSFDTGEIAGISNSAAEDLISHHRITRVGLRPKNPARGLFR
ncbi:MAG TPA: hypothetical protein VIX73_12320 [Kofleriaceae bacterium]